MDLIAPPAGCGVKEDEKEYEQDGQAKVSR
jgi:hypothetical protein